MKWFKHMTDSLDDPFIDDLITEFGPSGYMMYFGIIELICKESDDGKVTLSWTYIQKKLRTKRKTIQKFLGFCSEQNKFLSEQTENKIVFDFPKLLEIRDEYSRKSGVDPDKVRSKKQKQKQKQNKETDVSAKADERIKKLIDFYHDSYLKEFGEKPIINGGQDGNLIKKLLVNFDEELIQDRITKMLVSSDEFISGTGRTIGVLYSCFNKLGIVSPNGRKRGEVVL